VRSEAELSVGAPSLRRPHLGSRAALDLEASTVVGRALRNASRQRGSLGLVVKSDLRTPLVSIVAVNYNGLELLDAFLESVATSDYAPVEVIVVDNASHDESVSFLHERGGVEVLVSPENIGFGRGCNLGARHARGELLLFMNVDIVLLPDTVRTLVRNLLDDPAIAISCATLIDPDVSERHREPRVHDVAAMAAATMLVEREHFDALGGFDPSIFLYFEDTDLCYRTWLAGRRVVIDKDALAIHERGGTGGGHSHSAQQIQNGLYVHLKSRSWRATMRFASRMVVKTVVRGVGRGDVSVVSAWTRNARDFPRTMSKRRATLGAASSADRAKLERLGIEHLYWTRRNWKEQAGKSARRRIARSSRER
jgi:N-acetylglucosaminyl-diphospho-decaprenol L-rhamnosyltransferase